MELNEAEYELGFLLASPRRVHDHHPLSCLAQSTSVAEPTPKHEVKGARRVRNACLQCRERKIRCSRTYPCKGCVARGDGTACDWQGGFPTGNIPSHQRHVADQRRQIEDLKDRLVRAKACLSAAIQRNSTFNLEINESQARPPLIVPAPSPRETLSWFLTGSSNQSPGSVESNISSFSTNTAASSQSWSRDDLTACSLLNIDFLNSPSQECDPFRLFSLSHKLWRGYRALSTLREEDGEPLDGSWVYGIPCQNRSIDELSTLSAQSTIKNTPICPPPLPPDTFGSKLTPRSQNVTQFNRSSSLKVRSPLRDEALTIRPGLYQDQRVLAPFPVVTSHSPPSEPVHWPLTQPERISSSSSSQDSRLAESYEQHREPFDFPELDFIAPSRQSRNFNLPYITSLRTNDQPSSLMIGLCHQYLPQRQYATGPAIAPRTEPTPFNIRELSWDSALPLNLHLQGTQADVGLGLVSIAEPCGLLPSGFGLAPIIEPTQLTTDNHHTSKNNWTALAP